MAHLIVRGGTIGVTSGHFPAGIHEVTNLETLSELEIAVRDLSWATLDWDYREPNLLTTGETDVAQPALDTPGQKLIAETRNGDLVKTAVTKIDEATTTEDVKREPGFPCPYCERNLRNEGARISHIRGSHADKLDAFLAERRAARDAGEHGWGDNAPDHGE